MAVVGLLGKRPALEDARTLKLANYLDLPRLKKEFPAEINLHEKGMKSGGYPWYKNDQVGCCALVGPAHMDITWTANAEPVTRRATEYNVLSSYQTISGWNGKIYPGNPTDVGCYLIQVMRHWRRFGINGGSKIKAFASVDRTNTDEMKAAIYLFGGIIMGFNLPRGAQELDDWKAPKRSYRIGKWAPGSWGGHCVVSGRYSPEWLTVTTWGSEKRVSWFFKDAYCDECYCAISEWWLDDSTGNSPHGIHRDHLVEDLKKLGIQM